MNIDYTGHDNVTYTVDDISPELPYGKLTSWECECGATGPVDEPNLLRMNGYMAHLDTLKLEVN